MTPATPVDLSEAPASLGESHSGGMDSNGLVTVQLRVHDLGITKPNGPDTLEGEQEAIPPTCLPSHTMNYYQYCAFLLNVAVCEDPKCQLCQEFLSPALPWSKY